MEDDWGLGAVDDAPARGSVRLPRLAPGRRAAWRRRVWRRVVAATLAVGAVLATVAATRPEALPDGVSVVVSVRALPAGATVGTGDVQVREWPADLVPEAALGRAAEVVGGVLAGPVGAGEPLTRARLVGADLLAGQPAGTAAAWVPLQAGGVATMLRPGVRVDVVAADGRRLSTAALVLAVVGLPGAGDDGGLGLGAVAGSDGGPGVVLAVPGDDVAALAGAVDPGTGTTPTVVLSGG